MPVTLSTLDHAYDAPDGSTITKVLAGLDGKRNLVATLAREEEEHRVKAATAEAEQSRAEERARQLEHARQQDK